MTIAKSRVMRGDSLVFQHDVTTRGYTAGDSTFTTTLIVPGDGASIARWGINVTATGVGFDTLTANLFEAGDNNTATNWLGDALVSTSDSITADTVMVAGEHEIQSGQFGTYSDWMLEDGLSDTYTKGGFYGVGDTVVTYPILRWRRPPILSAGNLVNLTWELSGESAVDVTDSATYTVWALWKL